MGKGTFFLVTMVATGLFVYLVASFLVATFNITLWYDYYRFFVLVAYLFLMGAIMDGFNKKSRASNKKAIVNAPET